MMKRLIFLPVAFTLFNLAGCIHPIYLQSMDGEKLRGKYRFARDDTGLIQIVTADGETLAGQFAHVGRAAFVEGYQKTFGSGSIAVDGPDTSAYGNAFSGNVASSRALTDSAHGERFNADAGDSQIVVTGPLFYWTVSLRGNRGNTMGCYFIGSSYTGRGFGRCKSHTGKEYSAEF